MALTKVRGDGVDSTTVGVGLASTAFKGREVVLDADGDTTIAADTDDTIDFKIQGTDRVKINPTGQLTVPNQPAFHLTGDNLAWSGSNTVHLLPLNNARVDIGGNCTTTSSNYRFTAPIAGNYFVSIGGHIVGFGNDVTAGPYIWVHKNGTGDNIGGYMYYTGYNKSTMCGVISLAVNDYIDVRGINYNSTSFTLNCEMSGHLIG